MNWYGKSKEVNSFAVKVRNGQYYVNLVSDEKKTTNAFDEKDFFVSLGYCTISHIHYYHGLTKYVKFQSTSSCPLFARFRPLRLFFQTKKLAWL